MYQNGRVEYWPSTNKRTYTTSTREDDAGKQTKPSQNKTKQNNISNYKQADECKFQSKQTQAKTKWYTYTTMYRIYVFI